MSFNLGFLNDLLFQLGSLFNLGGSITIPCLS